MSRLAVAATLLFIPVTYAGAQQSTTDVSQTPAAYAAAASPGADPRHPPAAKPGALTLQQVLEAARQHNPTLAAAEQNLRGVKAQEIQAGVRVNPTIGVTGQNVTVDSNGQNPYFYT
ncbi:MAG TPA: TolC family protein, partial [Terriglobus sp.]